jgi:salicylate hydroxylase
VSSILIVGGGIGGLTAALALLQCRFKVRVLEQSRELREVGAGLTLTPNASRAPAALGLAETLDAIGSAPARGVIRHYASGATLVPLIEEDSRARYGAPVYHVHRADLHRILLQAIEIHWPGTVSAGCEVIGLKQDGNSVTAVLADDPSTQVTTLGRSMAEQRRFYDYDAGTVPPQGITTKGDFR